MNTEQLPQMDILMLCILELLFRDSGKASCLLLAKAWVQDKGKLAQKQCGYVAEGPDMTWLHTVDIKQGIKQKDRSNYV